jgi:sulfur-carrier protein
LKVEVRLFATFTRYLPPRGVGVVEVPAGSTVGDLAHRLAIPPGLERVTLVNGEEAWPERPLQPGDVVTLFPPLAGGRSSEMVNSKGFGSV